YDEVPKARYTKWPNSLFIDELKRRSAERVQQNQEFHYVMEDMARLRHKLDENRISLTKMRAKKNCRTTRFAKRHARKSDWRGMTRSRAFIGLRSTPSINRTCN